MIIIKIIILYFIQIRHTDDFPSTGTRLVYNSTSLRELAIFLGALSCFQWINVSGEHTEITGVVSPVCSQVQRRLL